MSTSVVVSDLFGRSYNDLDGALKSRVMDFVVKLQRDPTAKGLHIEPMTRARDRRVRTGRVTDSWRAVLIKLPAEAGYILVAVKPHDEANSYAADLAVSVNEVTGAVEIVNTEQLATAIDKAAPDAVNAASRVMPASVRERDLVRLGVAAEVAERILAITDENALLDVAAALPRAQGDAVLDLQSGLSPDDVWRALMDGEPTGPGEIVDTDDVAAALARPQSRLSFTALTGDDSIDELRAVLEGSLAAWRVWLHPLQRRLATHDGWNGPYRVTGGAGTGKTVTALHRARHLARREEPSKILFTTFTRNLATTIRGQLIQLAGERVAERVDVLNIDAVASRVLRSTDAGRAVAESRRLVGDDQVMDLWAVAATGTDWPVDFLHEEWSQVVLAQQLTAETEYRVASRSGRGRRLSRPQRVELWQVFERFGQQLRVEGVATYVQQVSEAAALLMADESVRRDAGYVHAVIDEAQDLHPAHWRLLRALVPPGQDDLFIVGDAHQRIYGRPVPLSRFGIETRGRSRRLTVNYRTSREILRWCMRVVDPAADDLDGEQESLTGARSLFGGPEPSMAASATVADEHSGLSTRISAWLESGIAPGDAAVLVRDKRLISEVSDALTSAGIAVTPVDARSDDTANAVRVMTMHRAKGLEFRAVALPHLSRTEFPAPFVKSLGEERPDAELAERNLLYVAASRARETLYVSWTGTPSVLLEELVR